MTLPHRFIFVFILYFVGAILPKNIFKSADSKKRKKGRDRYIEAQLTVEGGLNFLDTVAMFYVNNGNYE